MLNLFSYIRKFSEFSFKEKSFNDVDATIVTMLSYLNYDLFINFDSSLAIKDIGDDTLIEMTKGEFVSKENIKLLHLIRNSKRYKDITATNVKSVTDKDTTLQFFAVTFIIPNCLPMIAFRGTDLTLVGWKEDLLLAVHNVIPSQIEAMNYLHEVSQRIGGDFIISGHSKGGNLAIFSAVFANDNIQNCIQKIYNFDGPGFKNKDILAEPKYLKIEPKIIQIVPYDDVVGAILYTPKNTKVVKSKSVNVLQHDPYRWVINDKGEFVYEVDRSKRSKINQRALTSFIEKLASQDKDFIIEAVVNFFGGESSTLNDFFNHMPRRIYQFIKLTHKYSDEDKKKIKNALKLLRSCYKESRNYFSKR